jgi:hypothetical protein
MAHGAEASDPAAIRARIDKTRAALGRKLGALEGRLLGEPGPAKPRGKKTMAEKKKTAKKQAAGRKGGKAPARKSGHAKTTTKLARKTKEVVTDALVGAAVGAVQGAAEAVMEDMAETTGGKKARKGKK